MKLLSIFVRCGALLLLATSAAAADRPNVVVIMADDLGYSDLGCYGGEIATPNLDGLAANGLRFTQFYNMGRCWPTRASLLSGYYPHQIRRDDLPGVPGGTKGTRPDWARLLPEYLAPQGYRSYHSGKWHIDGPVLAAGFARSLNVSENAGHFSPEDTRLDDKRVEAPAENRGWYATTAIADHAVECLKEHAAQHGERPFFSYVAFIAPHFPLHALPEDIERYRDAYLEGWDNLRAKRHARQQEMGIVDTDLSALEPEVGPPYAFPAAIEQYGPDEVNRPLPWSELTEGQRRFQATKMAIHAAMVDRMDREIGRILDQLKTMGAYENTLILFASDNGASAEMMIRGRGHDPTAAPGSAATFLCLGPGFSSASNTPFRRHKTWMHEGGISTPLVVHWPAGIAAKGELRQTPSHVIDVVPTILEAAGVELPGDRQGTSFPKAPGVSLVPAFASDVPLQRMPLWWLHEGNRALRDGDWKLVAAKGEPWQLYDMRTDRAEQHDLASERPEKAQELEAKWTAQLETIVRDARASAPAKRTP